MTRAGARRRRPLDLEQEMTTPPPHMPAPPSGPRALPVRPVVRPVASPPAPLPRPAWQSVPLVEGNAHDLLLEGTAPEVVEAVRRAIARWQLEGDEVVPSPIAVTSALHGEGTTTISSTLAAVLAHDTDAPVCWVDLSWAGSTGSAEEGPDGLYQILTGAVSLDDVLPARGARLVRIHGGGVPPAHRHLVARSEALEALLEEVTRRVSHVVLDLPPVLASSGTLALARHAAGVLLVVRHGATTRQQINEAARELRALPSLGVVLNGASSPIPRAVARLLP